METTVLSVGKSALDGALGYAKSALAEEVALQLGVHRDHAFIKDELEMMRAFLMAAHKDSDDDDMVVKTWVKQVRDVAYDAEDSLQDFAVRLGKPSWWRLPATLLDRRRVATRMKELRGKIEDVSQRNVRYQLIRGSGSNKAAATTFEQSCTASAVLSGTDEAMQQRNQAKLNLIRLIQNRKEEELQVIAIWGTTNGVLFGEASVVKRAYDDLKRHNKFQCYAWINIAHPFNRVEFVQNIMRQCFVDSLHEAGAGMHDLRRMAKLKENDLIGAFKKYVNNKSFLIVLGDLSSNEEWNQIKECFVTNKKVSRLIVCTEKVEVASLCVGEDNDIPEHKQLSTEPALLAFYEKDSRGGTYSKDPGASSNVEITEENSSSDEKRLTRIGTMISAFKESQLVGRMNEKSEIIKLVLDNSAQEFQVISIWGMGGLGKTTLVKQVYQSQELSNRFEKRACVTIKRPFNQQELLNNLVTQLNEGDTEKTKLHSSLIASLEGKKYLIVLDDLSSTAEWDAISHYFPRSENESRIIITTRVQSIAKHCSKTEKNTRKLEILGEKDASDLFTEKVFGKQTDLDEQYPELAEVAKLILKKCNGLPLAIVTIGGFLSKQPKTSMEWRNLNNCIGVELEMNREFGSIKDILMKSYDGLPYHLKSCFLYMSIFPEDYIISRRRLMRRWIAEGYSSEVRGKSPKDMADSYLMELIDRSMILPFRESIGRRNGFDSCQVHDLMREISISKSLEENLVFRMEEGCTSNIVGKTRHLCIDNNWKGDQSEFEKIVSDLSYIRSLTVFGRWRPFYISERMKLLRVLDLEGTTGLFDHHLKGVGLLIHLKYFSIRGCHSIHHLPNSLGNLKQLETLDIYDTGVVKLPQCIIKLRKLQYVRAAYLDSTGIILLISFLTNCFPKLLRNRMCLCAIFSLLSSMACCNNDTRKCILGVHDDSDKRDDAGDSNKRDVCTWYCFAGLPFLMEPAVSSNGVVVPRGLRKLKALHTLGVVNIARGKSILHEIKCLTQLRKLAVTGINKKNCQEFCSILDGLCCLESLSVNSYSRRESTLDGCLDAVSSPPTSLRSIKVYGRLFILPEWMGTLQNLVKLKLEKTMLSKIVATIQVLGKLPCLAILRLLKKSFIYDAAEGARRVTFSREAPFSSLIALELYCVCGDTNLDYEFEEGAAPKLELLHFVNRYQEDNHMLFSGLESLPKLKEVQLDSRSYDIHGTDVQDQLDKNKNRPILKRS